MKEFTKVTYLEELIKAQAYRKDHGLDTTQVDEIIERTRQELINGEMEFRK